MFPTDCEQLFVSECGILRFTGSTQMVHTLNILVALVVSWLTMSGGSVLPGQNHPQSASKEGNELSNATKRSHFVKHGTGDSDKGSMAGHRTCHWMACVTTQPHAPQAKRIDTLLDAEPDLEEIPAGPRAPSDSP